MARSWKMKVRHRDTKTQSLTKALNAQVCERCAHWSLPRSVTFLFFVLCLGCPIATTGTPQQASLRVALIGFTHASSQEAVSAATKIEGRLNSCLTSDPRVLLVDDSIVRPALRGFGYDGSINMSRDEARRVGSAIGCDFYVIGKLEVLTRSERKGESHEEAFAGVMIVDGRTGELAVFDLVLEKAATREGALTEVEKAIVQRAGGYIDRIVKFRERAQVPGAIGLANSQKAPVDLIEDMPDADSPRAVGFKAPAFLSRVKPNYTAEAEHADITATVEALVVLRSNGEVGAIEVTRWAGFGLDESAIAAIKQFKVSPAQRNGIPISVRAMIRYNFRRVNDVSQTPEEPAPEPPAKPERDLRPLFKPTYRRP